MFPAFRSFLRGRSTSFPHGNRPTVIDKQAVQFADQLRIPVLPVQLGKRHRHAHQQLHRFVHRFADDAGCWAFPCVPNRRCVSKRLHRRHRSSREGSPRAASGAGHPTLRAVTHRRLHPAAFRSRAASAQRGCRLQGASPACRAKNATPRPVHSPLLRATTRPPSPACRARSTYDGVFPTTRPTRPSVRACAIPIRRNTGREGAISPLRPLSLRTDCQWDNRRGCRTAARSIGRVCRSSTAPSNST